ncbi:MAG: 4Fe-4S binding protein [Eubacteriales bacterium]|nr:4Fe-4S binding protein [Eubacteriales bacterium]
MARVIFNTEQCKGCGLCVNACPKKILSLDKGTINSRGYYPAHCTDQDACIGCASCARMCPDVCITVER